MLKFRLGLISYFANVLFTGMNSIISLVFRRFRGPEEAFDMVSCIFSERLRHSANLRGNSTTPKDTNSNIWELYICAHLGGEYYQVVKTCLVLDLQTRALVGHRAKRIEEQ